MNETTASPVLCWCGQPRDPGRSLESYRIKKQLLQGRRTRHAEERGRYKRWYKATAVTIAFLRFHERDAAVARLADAIRWYVCDQASHPDPVTAEFYRHALTRVDFSSIARDLIDAAEATGQSLRKTYRLPDKESVTA